MIMECVPFKINKLFLIRTLSRFLQEGYSLPLGFVIQLFDHFFQMMKSLENELHLEKKKKKRLEIKRPGYYVETEE